jgi:hypothetical protein
MKISTPSGQKELELREGDDPERAAESFVRMHHIPTQKITKVRDAIMANVVVESLAGGGGFSIVAAKQPAVAAPALAPSTAVPATTAKPAESLVPATSLISSSPTKSTPASASASAQRTNISAGSAASDSSTSSAN